MADFLAKIENLKVEFPGSIKPALAGVDLKIEAGQTVALTGPSGCGKSLTARALCGLLPPEAHWSGKIIWKGQELNDPQGPDWSAMRGRGTAMVLQEPSTCLNPVLRAGDQIAESVRQHHQLNAAQGAAKALGLLAEVQVPDPSRVFRSYPHQLSGGMRQRVLLAAALACDPLLLIADEVTTALDLTVQREILALLDHTRRRRNMGLLLISHDLDVVSLLTDQVINMAGGKVLGQSAPSGDIPLVQPPSSPSGAGEETSPLLSARGLSVRYPGSGGVNHSPGLLAVAGVDLDLMPGQALGLAGESGCGKTSLARALCRQLNPAAGTLELLGEDFLSPGGNDLRRMRQKVQMIFQDPGASLNPRQRIGDVLSEAAAVGGSRLDIPELLEEVGLTPDLGSRFPHELSGGQRQRVAVARCLAAEPVVIIADEITSALDQNNTGQMLALLGELLSNRQIALLLISHDLAVLHHLCHQVVVMYAGNIVEIYPVATAGELHPYTQALKACSPSALLEQKDPWQGTGRTTERESDSGVDGCPWHPHCPIAQQRCEKELPGLLEVAPGHWLRCPETNPNTPSHFIDT